MFKTKTVTIPRAVLQAAVERGIDADPDMRPGDKRRLRCVALTSRFVAAGSFRIEGCGCPATQAGILDPSPFGRAFDGTLIDSGWINHPTILMVD